MATLQITLTDAEQDALRAMPERTRQKEEHLIHEAPVVLLDRTESIDWKPALRKGRGLWRDRTDL